MGDHEVTIHAGMSRAVADTLGALDIRPEHAAIARLAQELALLLDNATTHGRGLEAYHKLTPRMAGVLRDLGATPAAGGRANREDHGDDDERDPDADRELADLERDAATRADRAAGVDPAPA